MRTANKNKQILYYANYLGEEPVYERDEDGHIVYMKVDGILTPIEVGSKEPLYSAPVKFMGNIAMSGGESEAVEYGIDTSSYGAVLVMSKNALPIDETSLIWFNTEPPEGESNGKTADYKVMKVSPSLNQDKYLLQKVIK